MLHIEIKNWDIFQAKFVQAIDKLPIHYKVVKMDYHHRGERLLIVVPNKVAVGKVAELKQAPAEEALAEVSGWSEGNRSPTTTQHTSSPSNLRQT